MGDGLDANGQEWEEDQGESILEIYFLLFARLHFREPRFCGKPLTLSVGQGG